MNEASFNIIAQNQTIPKDLVLNQRIVGVNFFDGLTVFQLENGYDYYFHNDTGEMELIKVLMESQTAVLEEEEANE
ncbi:hypothetical protein [Paenibacillus sp. ISL-20]|uniref:hypothetical protein n=1 Tax=Paenibacillus sp. ISL-20 TaxID=2819163 RepID=UPI001BE79937|nr:hypothetical protein [Paenibacillus sp. ISL-20]MBT2759994.1 hypothetical protein [Paenibacillus sp. ISL-20]